MWRPKPGAMEAVARRRQAFLKNTGPRGAPDWKSGPGQPIKRNQYQEWMDRDLKQFPPQDNWPRGIPDPDRQASIAMDTLLASTPTPFTLPRPEQSIPPIESLHLANDKCKWKAIKGIGATVYQVPPDGDCFFSAFKWLTFDPESVADMRARASDTLMDHDHLKMATQCLDYNLRGLSMETQDDNLYSHDAWRELARDRGLTVDDMITQMQSDPGVARGMLSQAIRMSLYYADEWLIAALEDAKSISCMVLSVARGRGACELHPHNLISDPFRPLIVVMLDHNHFQPLMIGNTRLWPNGVGQLEPAALRFMGLKSVEPILPTVQMPWRRLLIDDHTPPPQITIDLPGELKFTRGGLFFRGGLYSPDQHFFIRFGAIEIHVSMDPSRLDYVLVAPADWSVNHTLQPNEWRIYSGIK